MVRFATLHPDGRLTNEREVTQADIAACPAFILVAEHYRADGSCRCDDPEHVEMRAWGYTWAEGRWS